MTHHGRAAAVDRTARWTGPFSPRTIDRILALVCYPLVALLTLAPGGLHEPGDSGAAGPTVSGLVFRVAPGLLRDGRIGPLMAVDHWAVALAVFAIVPGAVSLAVLFRRSRPGWLMGIGVALLALVTNIVPIAVALYSHAAWSTDRRRLTAWTAAALAAFAVGLWGSTPRWSMLTMVLVALVVPISLGLWMHTRRRLVESLRDRAERLEHEQRLLAERATIAERTRIAGEMHDAIAHRVSLIVLHAGGIELSSDDPELAGSAEQISAIGREALSELREVLGVLYDSSEAAPLSAQPGLADIDGLIAQWRAAGTPVRMTTTGTPHDLAPRLQRTIYRVVREALTNAGKHAAAGLVHVSITHRLDDVAVAVVNDLVDSPAHTPLPPSGYGLAGLRERVRLAGGELSAGARPDGVWELRAVLPAGGSSAAPAGGAAAEAPRTDDTGTA